MPSPKVSVCIDVFNYADFLPDAIESVLMQTLSDFEVIVADDCSTDTSYEVAMGYARQDARVRVYRNPDNQGMVGNRNVALRLAEAKLIKILHADDYLCTPQALETLVARMDANPAASLVACGMQYVDAASQSVGRSESWFPDARFIAGTTVITRCLGEQKNLIGGPSATIFRRDRALRGFDEAYFHAADLEMWFHLLEQGCFGVIADPLVAYRWHARQQTEKDRSTLSQVNDQRGMLATYLDKPYIRLRPWLKEYLRHDTVRQTLKRCSRIGEPHKAAALLEEYGARKYFQRYPLYYAWRRLKKLSRNLTDSALPPALHTPPSSSVPSRPKGINVAGFLKGQYGIGTSSRAYCRAAAETGLPISLLNIESKDHSNRDASVEAFAKDNPYGVNLMTFSFDYARRFYRDRGSKFFEGRRNVALWYWELEQFPARWHSNFDYYDEIWAPTDFCAHAFAQVSPVPVHKVSYPLYAPGPVSSARSAFALKDDSFVFLFNFDFFSTVERKNPHAVIEAFRRAFEPSENVTLVLKSINSLQDRPARQRIEQAIAGLNVVWIESHLSGLEMDSLFSAANCYVSLHRSEGLGLGMAQAMSLGKPVIATGYSGNLEFMEPDNSLLVKYEMVEIEEDCGPYDRPPIYTRGSVWAEPDISDAAQKMRWVVDHRDESSLMGLRGRDHIRTVLNPERSMEAMRARIDAIYRG